MLLQDSDENVSVKGFRLERLERRVSFLPSVDPVLVVLKQGGAVVVGASSELDVQFRSVNGNSQLSAVAKL